MIYVIIGTRAQMIKTAPVLLEMQRREVRYRLILTGQHSVTMDEMLEEFGIACSPVRLSTNTEISSLSRVPYWCLRAVWRMRHHRRRSPDAERGGEDVYLVHGDTFSTLLGILLARRANASVAHVESGLTSGNWRDPFPEEMVRRIAMRAADLAFAPGAGAVRNMRGRRAVVVDTQENTILDSVRWTLAGMPDSAKVTDHAVVSLHRFETIYSLARLRFVVDFILELASRIPVVFVLHPATRRRLERASLLGRLEQEESVTVTPRMTYVPFIRLVAGAKLVVTDGGSNQEELSYLGVPTMLMREVTERSEGLGANVHLGRFRREEMMAFAESALEGRAEGRLHSLSSVRPSEIVVDELVRRFG